MRTAEHDGYLRGKPSLAFETVTQSLNLSHHHPLLSALQRPPSAGRGAPVQRETKAAAHKKQRMKASAAAALSSFCGWRDSAPAAAFRCFLPLPQLPLAVALRCHGLFCRCHPSSPDDGRDACSWRWGGCAGCARRGDCFAMRLVGCRRGRSRPVAVAADNYKGSSRGRAQAFGAWAWVRTMCRCSSRVRRGQL